MNQQASSAEPRWSVLTLFLAADEAARSDHVEVEPVHLLIGLCRLADLTPEEGGLIAADDYATIRAELEAFGIPPQQFRRRLRALVPKGGRTDAAEVMRRTLALDTAIRHRPGGVLSGVVCSAASQTAVARASQLAGSGRTPGARHLLRALLVGEMGGVAHPHGEPANTPDGIPDRI